MNESYNEAEREVLQAAVGYAVAPAIAWLETATPEEIRGLAGWPDSVPDELLRKLAFSKLSNGVMDDSLSPSPQTPLLDLDLARSFLRSDSWVTPDGPPDDMESCIRELQVLFLHRLMSSVRSVSVSDTGYWSVLMQEGLGLFTWEPPK